MDQKTFVLRLLVPFLALLSASCADVSRQISRLLDPPVPRTLAVRVLIDGREFGDGAAGTEGIEVETFERGDRAWVAVRNRGDRTRVIEQVAFEHRWEGPVPGPSHDNAGAPSPDSRAAASPPPGAPPGAVPAAGTEGRPPDPAATAKAGAAAGTAAKPASASASKPAADAPPAAVRYGPRVFVRGKDAGYSATIDTPEADAELFAGGARFWYTPYQALAPGGTYESHALVSIPTRLTGCRLAPAQGPGYNPAWRVTPWAQGTEPLDLGEIRDVQEAAARELPRRRDRPLLIHCGRLHDNLVTRGAERAIADIDVAADLGLEYVLLDEDLGSWSEDKPSEDALQQVFADARRREVKLGFWLSTNAQAAFTGRPWRPDRPDWALQQADGRPHPSGARCLGNPEFADWLSAEIERRLAAHPWALAGFESLVVAPCYAAGHGHPPGDPSRYAQARGAEALLRRVKERRPDVIFAAGQGWSDYAPRFARWIDLQSFGEETAMPFPGLSITRNVNDENRKERLLTHFFRFLPTAAHAGSAFFWGDAVDEPTEGGMPLTRARPGVRPPAPAAATLRYTLLQSLATCGNLALSGLHTWIGDEARTWRTEAEIAADRAFLRTWVRFAYDNAALLRETRFLTVPDVDVNNVEVYGHLARSEGLVFIVNPNPREARVRLETEGTVVWTQLHPEGWTGRPVLTGGAEGRAVPRADSPVVPRGDTAVVVATPPHTVTVLRVARRGAEDVRPMQATVQSMHASVPSPVFHERPADINGWAGAGFPALPGRPIAWRRIDTARGYAAEGRIELAPGDLERDLAFAIHLLQPERAETPAVTLNGQTVRAEPVILHPPHGSTPDFLGGFVVPSSEISRAVRAGVNAIRVEIVPKRKTPAGPAAAAAAEAGRRALFNGRDLEGWEPLGTAHWAVEDGAIVGGQDGDPSRSGLLVTRGQWKDFELELEFMIDEHGTYNSGVYLRNAPGTQARTGYQVNIGRGAAGEYCGGIHLGGWRAKGDEKDEIRKPGAWNAMRIRAEGGHIVVDLNGARVADYTDPAPEPAWVQKGVLGLQTYGAEGHAGWVKFRNLRIREVGEK